MTYGRRWVTLILHRDGAVSSRSIRLPLWLARALGVGSIVVGMVILIGAVLYAPIVKLAASVPSLNREIDQLRAENAQVHDLAATLARVEMQYEQVRTMLGGDVVPPRARTYSAPVAQVVVARLPGDSARFEFGQSRPTHWPLSVPGIVTRGMTAAESGGEPHSGLDIAVPIGTPIRASGGGTVSSAGWDPEYGLFVRLEHPGDYESMYGHASRLIADVGDTVQAGQVIALSGTTGRSTAPHLHFEITHEGHSIDPRLVLQEGS